MAHSRLAIDLLFYGRAAIRITRWPSGSLKLTSGGPNFESAARMLPVTTCYPARMRNRKSLPLIAVALAFAAASLAHAEPARPGARPAVAAPAPKVPALTKRQASAVATYERALAAFKAILATRRAQIDAKQPLPRLPGQAVYLARLKVMSTYKELTDAVPARIGRANQFGVPPAYFDADIEPLIVEYAALFAAMQAPPASAQASDTPFEDVADLGRAIARAKGLDDATAEVAARISIGLFFAETNGNQNIGNARSNTYKGSLQTGVAEDKRGQRKWAAIKARVAARDPAVAARDAKESARVGKGDQRFNHWTAVRNGLMNAHADVFAELPKIARMLPDPVDQMKLFQLIQLVPSPTRTAIASGNIETHRVSDRQVMGYLRNNSIFTFGHADRARTSATYREILDAMWLFTPKFARASAKYDAIEAARKKRAP